jgi:predicted DNA-binding transcriptional regulator AlpA
MDKMDKNKKQALEALRLSLGVVTDACKSIGLARSTFYNWVSNDEDFKKEVEDIQEQSVDFAESKLFQRIKGYNHPEEKIFNYEGEIIRADTTKHYPPDTTAIIFYLKTKGKSRGYIEKSEVETTTKLIEVVPPQKKK